MSGMRTLATLMKDLEDQLVVCMRCGMCQATCPLFAQTGREADVARGKLALLDGLMRELFKDPAGVQERLNRCLLCGSCAAACPSGVDVLDIFIKARAILAGFMGLSPAEKVVLRGMLAHPRLFDRLAEWGIRFQNLFTRPVNTVTGTSCARFVSPLLKNRHFPSLASMPFHRMVPSLDTAPGRSGIRVAFFVGCLIDKIFPRIARAVLSVLDDHGIGVVLPEGQACCGIPAVSAGDMPAFRRLVTHNIALFHRQRFDVLVTACATCTTTIRKIWPAMAGYLSPGLQEQVNRIAEKTMDINRFLVSTAGIQPRSEPGRNPSVRVTYHDPCHLKKSLGVFEEPRTLIRANPDYRLVEMADADGCCGMGGSFNLQYYEISYKIGKLKRDNINQTGCAVLATGCPACMIQISDVLSRSADRVAVKHPVEIYAEALKRR